MKGEVQVGDVVRVSYEGTVETVMSNSGGVRVNGAWHHVHSRAVTSVEIIEPALRVG